MIEDIKPYSAMKTTGLPWCPQVPDHWELKPNRALLRKRKVLVGDQHSEYRLLSLTKAGVIVRDISTGRGKFSADMGTSQEVREGDLVFCLFDVPETPRTVGLSRHHGMITGAYTVFECKDKQLAQFLEAFYIAIDDRKLLSPLYSGLRNTIPPPVLLGQKTPLPPAPEQAAIVRFLDHADRKIRRYIRAKQKLIKLLEEQKQVIIHRAVTRGLDPNVRLKASGVEWLGDVPEHWTLYRPKLLFRQVTLPKPANAEMVTCFRDGQVTLRRNRRTEGFTNAIKELGYQGIMAGQLVLHSMDAFAGAIGVSDSEGKCSPEYVICEPSSSGICVKYYALLLRSLALRGLFVVLCPSVRERAPRVRFSDFGSFELPKPPLREQEQVVDAIEAECSEVERSLQSERRSVCLVGEYRTRLIADVVTGKLDVREAAAQLPDDYQEIQLFGDSDEISASEDDDTDDLDEAPEDAEP
jgi:type I restriction enzyme S subunit